jgi:hypothetical protein
MPFNAVAGNGGANGVRQFWLLLAGLAGALVTIGVFIALYIVQNKHHKSGHALHLDPYLIAAILIIFGVAGQVVVRFVRAPLKGDSDASLLASYRARFFLWVGVGEAPAFIGLAAAVATGRFWLYPVGVVFAFVSYVHIAPTARHIAKDQAELDRSGSRRSLISALATMPARRSRR